ncbi:MAG: hypothetical protein PHG16_11860 [Lachnospiraceae bacterium]|nr:hypothetical protein [Lachnospiraceae bacterium]
MQTTHCTTDAKHIRRFLNACKGNWHNCIYVDCTSCKELGSCAISSFLFLPDADLMPCLLPLHDVVILFQEMPDSAECLDTLTIRQFLSLYQAYLGSHAKESSICPCIWMLQSQQDANYDW